MNRKIAMLFAACCPAGASSGPAMAGHFKSEPVFDQDVSFHSNGSLEKIKTKVGGRNVAIDIDPAEISAVGGAIKDIIVSIGAVFEKIVGSIPKFLIDLLPSLFGSATIPADSNGPPIRVALQDASTLQLDLSAFGYDGLGGGVVYSPTSPITDPTTFAPIDFSWTSVFSPSEFPTPTGYRLVGFDYLVVTEGLGPQQLAVAPPVFAAVPEPETWLLLGFGAIAAAAVAARRRSRPAEAAG